MGMGRHLSSIAHAGVGVVSRYGWPARDDGAMVNAPADSIGAV
jgi:hypothetical protein